MGGLARGRGRRRGIEGEEEEREGILYEKKLIAGIG
jgi:hypothetical protein